MKDLKIIKAALQNPKMLNLDRESCDKLNLQEYSVKVCNELIKNKINDIKVIRNKRNVLKPKTETNLKQRLISYKSRKGNWNNKNNYDDIITAQKEHGKVIINNVRFQTCEDVNYDNDRYSKSYHSQFGGVKEISNRRIEILNVNKFFNIYTTKIASLERFSGNYLIDAIANYFKLQPIKVSKELKSVQLNKFFNPILIKKLDNIQIYKIMFIDSLVNFCAVSNGITFHSKNQMDLFSGLKEKLNNKTQSNNELITFELCKSYGFCEYGIEQFKIDNNIESVNSISRIELQKIINLDKPKNKKYTPELRKLGISI